MKIIISLAIFILSGFLMSGCRKEGNLNGPNNTNKREKLSSITYDFGNMDLIYNNDGSLKSVVIGSGNSPVETVLFRTNGGRYESVTSNDRIYTYYYAGNLIEKIEVRDRQEILVAQYNYLYQNNTPVEQILYVKSIQTGELVRAQKMKYIFSPQGNLIKSERFISLLNQWAPGQISTYEYDETVNYSSYVESKPYFPEHIFHKNNVTKQINTNVFGDTLKTILHTYTYSNTNKAITKKTVTTDVGTNVATSVTSYQYAWL